MEILNIQGIPAVVYGEPSERLYLFVHGKNGCKEEGERFASIACGKGYQVLSFDLPEHGERVKETGTFTPWQAVPEFNRILAEAKNRWKHISLRANSIGAYFSMLGFAGEHIERSLFVSPILDMEQLIGTMMTWSGVTEEQLKREKSIPTAFGETLSWEYLRYVREHRITKWDSPTSLLYGTADNLTDRKTLDAFAARFECRTTVMEGGEHWFHTAEQLDVLDHWTAESII